MPEYRNRTSGAIKTDVELKAENKNMSLPKVWGESTFDALDVDPILASPQPAPSDDYKVVVRNGVVQDSDGNWVQAWIELDRFTEYTDDNGDVQTVEAQKAAHDAAKTASLAASKRATRDELLKETDHYGLSDVTMSDEMTTYRQALRDVPQQSDFPSTITWPEKP